MTDPLIMVLQLLAKLRAGRNVGAGEANKGKVTVRGSNASVQHTINEDERTEFTRHINQSLAGDVHIGKRLPIPTDTFQLFDECKGEWRTTLLTDCSLMIFSVSRRSHLVQAHQ